jgi:acetyl esterase
MQLSEEVKKAIAFAEAMSLHKLHLNPLNQTREMVKYFPQPKNPTQVGEIINLNITNENIPVRIYIPEGAGDFPVVSFFHGGGFVLMNLDTHDEICRQLCAKSQSVVMSVDYRLAPEYPYPMGPNDCVLATQWMLENGKNYRGDSSRMAVAGDSAGGYMAIWVARRFVNESIPLKAQLLIYPVTDHYTSNHPSWEENKEGFILTPEAMKWYWDLFLPDPTKYDEASPLRVGNFKDFPPSLVITCEYDILRDEGQALAAKLAIANVPIRYENFDNIHGFFATGEMGREAVQIACDFLIKQLK